MKVVKVNGERSTGDVKLTLWDDNAKVSYIRLAITDIVDKFSLYAPFVNCKHLSFIKQNLILGILQ